MLQIAVSKNAFIIFGFFLENIKLVFWKVSYFSLVIGRLDGSSGTIRQNFVESW